MRNLLFLFFLVLSANLYCQNDNQWKKVYKDELNGKIESAQKKVEEIYKIAKRKKNEVQIVKCFFYLSKFEQVFDEKAQTTIIQNLRKEINEANPASRALLYYIYGNILQDYYNTFSYQIKQRTILADQKNDDFLTWTSVNFEKEIESAFSNCIENEKKLRIITIDSFKEVFEIAPNIDQKNYSLYDFLAEKTVLHYKIKINTWDIKSNKKNNDLFENIYVDSKNFINYKTTHLEDENLKKLLHILQKNEQYYLSTNNKKIDVAYYERLKFAHSIFQNDSVFQKHISLLEKNTSDELLKQQLRVDRAKFYTSQASKESKINMHYKALTLIDTIFQAKANINALADAEKIKHDIESKWLSITFEKTIYPNQNSRALVNFKNIDSIKISYYLLPVKNNDWFNNNNYYRNNKLFNTDSLVLDFKNKNIPIKSYTRKLPSKGDYFQYSTEILLEKMDVGNYLVVLETTTDSFNSKTFFTYDRIEVTNFFVVEDNLFTEDSFSVLDRKTGKPIEKVFFRNEEETITTNEQGKAYFKLKKYDNKRKYDESILIFKDNDTLKKTYNRNFIYDNNSQVKYDKYEHFEAKAMIYFDRAIYRPGQKLYYKGILIQNIDNIKSVVPHVSVHVSISDVNNTILKEFDIQTNEFGSFSGEFDIPKNVLTGEFNFEVEEAENYAVDTKYYNEKEDEHEFWDNVDFNQYEEFSFQVEEYKRPTFEVKFDTIKENYTIGDSIKIKGNAKALAGNNLTNAEVAYSISRSISVYGQYFPNETNFINTETSTDENGNFTIEFPATFENIKNDSINSLNYTINVNVIDSNGETRSASQVLKVGKEMLALNILLNNNLFIEDTNKLTINSTTLNNYPIDAKGKIKIYENQSKKFLKQRLLQFPEIQTISRNEFEVLFPNEPYDQSDNENKETLINTIPFDTKNGKEISLAFLKNATIGNYSIVIEAYDFKNNLITERKHFTVVSKKPTFSKNELFTYKDVSKPNTNQIEIEIQSVIPDLWISSRFYEDKDTVENEQVIQLENGKGTFKFLKKSDYKNNLNFHFSTIWENISYYKTYSIQKNDTETSLKIDVESMRNKIEPGSEETWSFKILNQKLQSEILASMYDSSLDQFMEKNWENIYFYNHTNTPDYPNLNSHSLTEKYFYNLNDAVKLYSAYYYKKTNLNWFGFDFKNPKNTYVNEEYLYSIESKIKAPKNAKNITGIVSDEIGLVVGAIVKVKGTNRTTTTNFDGEFEIEAAPGEILEILFLDSKEKILIGSNKNYTITLKSELKEVVITAYGIPRATKKMAYATQKVERYDLNQNTKKSLIQELEGKISGLQINTKNSNDASTSIILRGNKSSSDNNEILLVIDGVISSANNLLSISPDIILEVQVLKGHQGTALYGSQGANGVLVITTKNALKEMAQVKTRTNFNETAFFYPNLKTDTNGKVSFNFTTPESLTQWKLRLYAHNKKAETGYFESSIISQKDVMIQTNMPRFVREKDTINIAAKVVNMTHETKSGIAMLILYNASTMKPIDSISLNMKNTRNFSCKPKESVAVNWKITIPEGLQGLQYKIVAKSDNFSDGEENILPVLSNKTLITESIPIWIKGNSNKDYVFENLKNNDSKTLKNHQLTLEYTSNPIWFAIQALPYLIEYEHECAEQTFSRYYANFIATELINSNPKIATLFNSWKDNPKAVSKLTQNEELKSVVLNETPWLLDAENDELKNKRLALLMDINSMKESQEKTLEKLKDKQQPSGGFSWFDGGDENVYITQHIISGLGHLNKMFPKDSLKFEPIITKAIPYLDANFIKTSSLKNERIDYYTYSNLHFMYARSFYLEKIPISKKMDSILTIQKAEFKTNWLKYSIYKKALLALTMHRFGEKEFANKIIINLKETASRNDENGMYWLENNNGHYWYQSAIETQALLIEAFSEIEKDKKYVEEMKVWLLKNKQVNQWATTKATTEAIYALLLQGNDWTSIKDNTKFKIGNDKIMTKKLSEKDKEAETGYIKINWASNEILNEMGTISVKNKTDVPGYGGVYWQYFENLENIKSDSTAIISVTKNLYKKIKTTKGNELIDLTKETIKTGDLITIRLIIKTENDLEFVHLKDLRASCFEPINIISNYQRKDNLNYYMSTKDAATHFFFDTIKKGIYVLEYDVRINNSGSFNDGIATIQSMYAPEFSGHSISNKINVIE